MKIVAAVAASAVIAGAYAIEQSAPVITEGETIVAAPVAAPQETIIEKEEQRIVAPAMTTTPAAVPAPVVESSKPVAANDPPITVTEQRLTVDERIQQQVMDKLANNPTLSGKVGVETRDQVVNLSGYLMTNGMVMRANRDAGSVVGVRYVVNEIRTKIGPVTY